MAVVTSQATNSTSSQDNPLMGFGPNEWIVEDMYQRYLSDPASVDPAWHDFFADYRPPGGDATPVETAAPAGSTAARTEQAKPAAKTEAPAKPAPKAEPPAKADGKAAGARADGAKGGAKTEKPAGPGVP